MAPLHMIHFWKKKLDRIKLFQIKIQFSNLKTRFEISKDSNGFSRDRSFGHQCALCQIYAESRFNNTQFAPNQLWIAPGTWHCYYAFICSVIVRPTGIRLLKTWYVSFFWTWNDIALELLDSRYFVQSCVPNIPYNENKCNAIRF